MRAKILSQVSVAPAPWLPHPLNWEGWSLVPETAGLPTQLHSRPLFPGKERSDAKTEAQSGKVLCPRAPLKISMVHTSRHRAREGGADRWSTTAGEDKRLQRGSGRASKFHRQEDRHCEPRWEGTSPRSHSLPSGLWAGRPVWVCR